MSVCVYVYTPVNNLIDVMIFSISFGFSLTGIVSLFVVREESVHAVGTEWMRHSRNHDGVPGGLKKQHNKSHCKISRAATIIANILKEKGYKMYICVLEGVFYIYILGIFYVAVYI